MIGYMSLEEQIDKDFARARRKAFLRRIGARLRNDSSDRLLPFEETSAAPRALNGFPLGRREVPVEKIVGSVGRYSDFDGAFLPARASVGTRWKRVDQAFHRGEELPPVNLYKIGDAYFVLDGNHRVSVARYHGVETIDADVVEFGAARATREERGGPKITDASRRRRSSWSHPSRPVKKGAASTNPTRRATCRESRNATAQKARSRPL